jgi:hypothetical protein
MLQVREQRIKGIKSNWSDSLVHQWVKLCIIDIGIMV